LYRAIDCKVLQFVEVFLRSRCRHPVNSTKG
jgi:hypothetical protein